MLATLPLPPRAAASAALGWRFQLMVATAFFIAAICWSPLLPGLLHLDNGLAFLAAFLVYAALTMSSRGVSVAAACSCALIVVACLALFIGTGSRTLLARVAPIPMLLFAARQTTFVPRLIERLCDVLSAFAVFAVVMSIIGFAYAWFGGQPLLSIENGDGRENALYLTTMTNFWVGTVIRPSFIYDEPGAFSFALCAIVAMREMLGRPARLSWLVLLGGLITLSITHMLILALYMLWRLGFARSALIAAVVAVAGAISLSSVGGDELGFVADRFTVDDGKLSGDNRSDQISNFLNVVNPEILLVGDVECQKRPERACEEHGDISSSPVTPVYRGGLLMLVVQVWTHVALIACAIRRRAFVFPVLALSLMLLQRPYFEGYGYGFFTYLLLFSMQAVIARQRARGGVAR